MAAGAVAVVLLAAFPKMLGVALVATRVMGALEGRQRAVAEILAQPVLVAVVAAVVAVLVAAVAAPAVVAGLVFWAKAHLVLVVAVVSAIFAPLKVGAVVLAAVTDSLVLLAVRVEGVDFTAAALAGVLRQALPLVVLYASFGPVLPVNSHRLIRETFNGTRRAAIGFFRPISLLCDSGLHYSAAAVPRCGQGNRR
jgi:hypothetical protein